MCVLFLLGSDWFNNVLMSISAVGLLIIGCKGLNTWKKEHLGKKKQELAEEVLVLFYQARDAIRSIRNPFGRVGEGVSRQKKDNETEKQTRVFNQAYIVFERYDKYKEIFYKIHALRYRAKLQLRIDLDETFDKLNKIINSLLSASRSLASLWCGNRCKDRIDEYEKIIWDEGKEDSINKEIDKIIEEIENICNKHLN